MIQLSVTAVSLASGVGSNFQNIGGVFEVAIATAVFGQWHPTGDFRLVLSAPRGSTAVDRRTLEAVLSPIRRD